MNGEIMAFRIGVEISTVDYKNIVNLSTRLDLVYKKLFDGNPPLNLDY